MTRFATRVYLLIVSLLWLPAFVSPLQAQGATDALQVAGLSEPVEILTDYWGISHIGILFEMCTMIAKSGRRSDAGFK